MLDVKHPLATTADELRWDRAVARLWAQDVQSPWFHCQGYLLRHMATGVSSCTKSTLFPAGLLLRAKPFREWTTPPVVNHNGVFDAYGNRVADWALVDREQLPLGLRRDFGEPVRDELVPGSLQPVSPRWQALPPVFYPRSGCLRYFLADEYVVAGASHWLCAARLESLQGRYASLPAWWSRAIPLFQCEYSGLPWTAIAPSTFRAMAAFAKEGVSTALCDAPPSNAASRRQAAFWYHDVFDGGDGRRLACGGVPGEGLSLFWHPRVSSPSWTTHMYYLSLISAAVRVASACQQGTAMVRPLSREMQQGLRRSEAAATDYWAYNGATCQQRLSHFCHRRGRGWRLEKAYPPRESRARDLVTRHTSPCLCAPLVAAAFSGETPVQIAWLPGQLSALCWSDKEEVVLYQRGLVSWETW